MIELQNYRAIALKVQKHYADNIPKIRIQNKILGTLNTVHKKDPYNLNYITTELRNSYNKIVGQEIFSFNDETKNSTGLLIKVLPEYRQKGFKFGEILRLSSIMMIIENKIKNFEIYSKQSAIYFHSKYKFEPAIMRFDERNKSLESILKNCKNKEDYQEFYLEAKTLLEEAARNISNNEIQRELCKNTNQLLKRYISKVLQKKDEYKEHPFSSGITMKLTLDNINTHKNFFNDLFKKHAIDYKI